MKRLFTAVILSLSFLEAPAIAENKYIKDRMEKIDEIFKLIKRSATDKSQNDINADGAYEMSQLFQEVMNETPEHIRSIPASHQAEALRMYKRYIQQAVDLSQDLQEAFEANDSQGAVVIIKSLQKLKSDSHDEFNP